MLSTCLVASIVLSIITLNNSGSRIASSKSFTFIAEGILVTISLPSSAAAAGTAMPPAPTPSKPTDFFKSPTKPVEKTVVRRFVPLLVRETGSLETGSISKSSVYFTISSTMFFKRIVSGRDIAPLVRIISITVEFPLVMGLNKYSLNALKSIKPFVFF